VRRRTQAKKNAKIQQAAKLQIALQPVEQQAAYVWERYQQTAKAWLADFDLEAREITRTLGEGGAVAAPEASGALTRGDGAGDAWLSHAPAVHLVDTSAVTVTEHTDSNWVAFLKEGSSSLDDTAHTRQVAAADVASGEKGMRVAVSRSGAQVEEAVRRSADGRQGQKRAEQRHAARAHRDQRGHPRRRDHPVRDRHARAKGF